MSSRCLLDVPSYTQPDDVSCGPTCLSQVLAWHGAQHDIDALAGQLRRNADGGTQGVYLGRLALELGYRVRLYPFGVRIFDPTWWECEDEEIIELLDARAAALSDPGERDTVMAWADYLRAGGYLAFREPSPRVLTRALDLGRPLICGLNATWLYREARTRRHDNQDDPIGGHAAGHFVVIRGYTGEGRHLHVNDPSPDAPFSKGTSAGRYPLSANRLLHALLLGDGTGDAVLVEIWPSPGQVGST